MEISVCLWNCLLAASKSHVVAQAVGRGGRWRALWADAAEFAPSSTVSPSGSSRDAQRRQPVIALRPDELNGFLD
jgi:hypothetical protein